LEAARVQALKQTKGDNTFIKRLQTIRETGLYALDVACQLAREQGHPNTGAERTEPFDQPTANLHGGNVDAFCC
jgi:hypothetical protein